MSRPPEDTKHGRCTATNRKGEQCGRAAIGEHGVCGYHGGKGGAPEGPANGRWEHGLSSGVTRPEDQPLLDAIKELTEAEILRDTLEFQTMRFFRAADNLEDSERADVMDALAGLINRVEEPSTQDLANIAQMLGQNNRAMREELKLIIRNAEKLSKIRDGETVRHEHDVDEETLSELKGRLESL